MIVAANVSNYQTRINEQKEYQLRKDADEVKAVFVLFNNNDGNSKTYRDTPKKAPLHVAC